MILAPHFDSSVANLIVDSPVPSVAVDSRGIILAVNVAMENLLDYRVNDLVGESLELLLPESIRDRHDVFFRQYLEKPRTRVMGSGRDLTVRRRDGSELPVEIGLSSLSTREGLVVLAVMVDISSRIEAQSREKQNFALYDGIFRSSPFSIITVDMKGVIISANAAAERMLRYREEELLGRPAETVILDPHELEWVAKRISAPRQRSGPPSVEGAVGAELYRGGPEEGPAEELECIYVRKDGVRIPVGLTLAPLLDADGELQGYMGFAQDISERKRAEEYIRYLAYHDELTDLPNRTLLRDRLEVAIERAFRFGQKVGVMLVDLDNFKRINDSLGHHAGDQVLEKVAKLLKDSVRTTDTVARMGGDEFVIVLSDVTTREAICQVAEDVVRCVSQPIRVGSHLLKVTPSVGVCVCPDDGDDPESLVMRADTAMYAAKAKGRANYQSFSPAMALVANESLELEQALRRALEQEQLAAHYQTQVDLASGEVVGVEALMRWHLPGKGNISPARFIAIAEDTDLILPMGEWVLHQACRDGRILQDHCGQRLRLGVNLSPRQLTQDDLLQVIESALSFSGLAPEDLELEITENVFMHYAEELSATMAAIRAMGVKLAIDDFGVGFSSLSYITRFTVDRIKLDQSFVENLLTDKSSEAVTNAVIAMARGLGIEVVAEGVETEAQAAYLRSKDCHVAQGYFFSRPAALEDVLSAWRR